MKTILFRPLWPSCSLCLCAETRGVERGRGGITLVEVLVAFVILVMFLGMVVWVFVYSGKTQETSQRLDAYHDARNADFFISQELKFSTGIIFPKGEVGKPSPTVAQLIFRNALNQVVGLYVNLKSQLVMVNFDQVHGESVDRGAPIAENIEKFTVQVLPDGVLEYQLTVTVQSKPFEIRNRILPLNYF